MTEPKDKRTQQEKDEETKRCIEKLKGTNFWSDPQDPSSSGFRIETDENGKTKIIFGHRKTKGE